MAGSTDVRANKENISKPAVKRASTKHIPGDRTANSQHLDLSNRVTLALCFVSYHIHVMGIQIISQLGPVSGLARKAR